MMTEQLGMVLVLGATMGMFLWGRWRHDVVAMAALPVMLWVWPL